MNIIKSFKKNVIVLLIVTIIVLFIVLKDDFNGIIEALRSIDIKYILLATVLYFISVALKGLVNYLIVNDKKKITIKEAIKHNVIAQFFNGVTPFSTGGQPMEIYMLTEHNIPMAKATTQTVQSFIFYQIALVICGVAAVIYNFIFHIFPKVKLLQHLVLLGFLINEAVIIILFLLSRSKHVMKFISKISFKIVKLLKLKITEEKVDEKFKEIYQGFQELKGRKQLVITGVTINILHLLCLYSIPLIIIYGLGDFTSINLIDTIVSSAYVYVIGAFVPIPGASGGIEYGFTQFFGNFISLGELSAVLILWRFITYYVGIIAGALIFNFEKKVQNEDRNIF